MIKKVRHIGIKVDNLNRAVKNFEGFGFICNEVQDREETGLRIAFLPVGDTLIELLDYSSDIQGDSSVQIARRSQGVINHVCFEVEDLEASIKDFEKNGAKLVEGCPRPGAHGRIAFFYPETTEGVLIELCEV